MASACHHILLRSCKPCSCSREGCAAVVCAACCKPALLWDHTCTQIGSPFRGFMLPSFSSSPPACSCAFCRGLALLDALLGASCAPVALLVCFSPFKWLRKHCLFDTWARRLLHILMTCTGGRDEEHASIALVGGGTEHNAQLQGSPLLVVACAPGPCLEGIALPDPSESGSLDERRPS